MLKRIVLYLLAVAMLNGSMQATGETAPAKSEEEVQLQVVSTDPADYAKPAADFEFGVQASEAVDMDYFDDAVFIGDSISLKLSRYVRKMRQEDEDFLGKAAFLVAGSLGSGNALWEISNESVHPSYKGEKMLLEDSVKATGAKKVYIMLGSNDVGLYGVEGSVENMRTLVHRILDKSPDAEIFIQSATPRIAAMKSNPTNRGLFDYNLKLYELCVEEGWHFIDVASVMRDGNGNLFDEYCSDAPTMGMHFTDAACQIWVDYLLTHAVEMEEQE